MRQTPPATPPHDSGRGGMPRMRRQACARASHSWRQSFAEATLDLKSSLLRPRTFQEKNLRHPPHLGHEGCSGG
eukprot:4877985-Lingulodinium_polyedra.AAC.1